MKRNRFNDIVDPFGEFEEKKELPFIEKFDDDEDVNVEKIEEDNPKYLKAEGDVDNIFNNEETKSQNQFSEEVDYKGIEQEMLRSKFKDYLQIKKISGKRKSAYSTSFIPSEKVIEKNEVVEIYDESYLYDKPSMVITHRNSSGEIALIEVQCSCGKRTIIKISSEDNNNSNNENDDSNDVNS